MSKSDKQEQNNSGGITHQDNDDILGNIHSFFGQALINVQNTANSSIETLAWTASTIGSAVSEGTTSNFNFLIDQLSSLVSGKEISEEQRQTALEIIKSGKDNGVGEMEIEVDQAVGMKLISDNEIFKSNAVIGSAGKMIIKIKYK